VIVGASAKKLIGPLGLQTRAIFYDKVADFITELWFACWAPSRATFYDKVIVLSHSTHLHIVGPIGVRSLGPTLNE
jgi:hypothetical protein